MQQNQQLNLSSVKQITVEILKSKGQWSENQTKVNVTNLHIQDCEIFLVQINCVSSTMMLSQNWPKLKLSASKRPIIMAFRADQQLAGKGQKQNTWQSPQGNLYITILMKLQFSHFPYLPIIAISNVFQTVKYFIDRSESKKSTMIKWINDVMVDFQKISGVLIKNQMIGQSLYSSIGTLQFNEGIGINVKKSPFNIQALNQPVTNLQKQIGKQVQIKQVCLELLQKFAESFYSKDFNQTKSQSKKVYQENLAYLNQDVLIYDFKYEKVQGAGVFKGINQFGHAIIQGIQQPFIQGRMKAHHLAL